MKFIHLGDLHFGKNVNDFSMIEDQKYILEEILALADREAVDGVILAGDIYDRAVPSEDAVKIFDYFLTELASRGKQVFAVSGNHDSDQRLHFGSKLFLKNNIYIAGRYDGEVECIHVEDQHGPLHIWLLPYIKASRVAHFFPDKEVRSYDAAFQTVVESCDINPSERNIMVIHQFVAGGSIAPDLAGSEIIVQNVGTIDQISYHCFDDFDYVAMGHIHSGQSVGRETCRYAGAPLKYSLNEREIKGEKSVPIVTFGEKGDVKVELFPLKPLREIRHIRGTLQDLLRNAVDTDDYIYATLTDEDPQLDALARLQEVYPRVMKLDYDNEAIRAAANYDGSIETEGKSFHELVADFFKIYHGKEPNEGEWKIIEEIAEEAGVIGI